LKLNSLCNTTNVIYEDEGSYLKVVSRGATTLDDCENSLGQEYLFFNITSANIYLQDPAKKLFYEITTDKKGLLLWTDVNEKLFFTKELLDFNKDSYDNLIRISPNPARDYLEIVSKGAKILKVEIFNIQGRSVIVKTKNFNNVNVSNLFKGVYFVEIKTNSSTITKKIIIY